MILALILSLLSLFQSGEHIAYRVDQPPVIDGKMDDACWDKADWYAIDQVWLGPEVSPSDFSGKFKVAWDENFIYVLVEVVDDTLMDIHEDGLVKYWDDDCVEVFFDEDDSDGEHTNNFNAFAYHIGLDYSVVDFGTEGPLYFNDHAQSARTKNGNTYTWEHRFKIFDDSFEYGKKNEPVKLKEGKIMGFAVAYCDNDYSEQRENFIGSVFVPGEDKNKGYIDAGIFGSLKLVN